MQSITIAPGAVEANNPASCTLMQADRSFIMY